MQKFAKKDAPIIIVGMHRSGSSLVTNLLNDAGLHVGERLMPGKSGNNRRGFFENLDFVELHETVLYGQGLSRMGWTLQPVAVAKVFEGRISEILEHNQRIEDWGWKDPRSTLFMDYWAERLPGARFLAVVRPPWEVVDSLYRRGDELFMTNPQLAVEIWNHYNRTILDFCKRHPERALLVTLDNVIEDTRWFVSLVNERFDAKLSIPSQDIFDPTMLTRMSYSVRQHFIEQFFPIASSLWQELNGMAARPYAKTECAVPQTTESDLANACCADWQVACLNGATINENQQLTARLEATTEQMQFLNDQALGLLEDRKRLADENNRLQAALTRAEEYVATIQKSRIWPVHRAIANLPDGPGKNQA